MMRYLLSLLFITSVAHAQPLQLATGEYLPYTSEALASGGIVTEIVERALEIAEIDAEIGFYPWVRAQRNISAGNHIASFPWAKTAEREKEFHFISVPVATNPTAVFYRKSRFPDGLAFNDYEDLVPYKAVGIRVYWYIENFKSTGIDYQEVEDSHSAIRFLEANRADVYVDSLFVGLNEIQQNSKALYDDISYSVLLNDADPYFYLMVNKNHPELDTFVVKMTQALQQLHDSGEFNKMMSSVIEK